MEDDPVSVSLLQWLGAWALAAGACRALQQPEHGEKPRDNGKGENAHGA